MKDPITSRITPILGTFHLASPADIEHGRTWYQQAHDACCDLSAQFPIGVITAAGVIAALSPNNRWDRNLLDAHTVIDAYTERGAWLASHARVATYGANLAKAITILKLQSPSDDDILNVLNGQKVSAFYRCILGDVESVCVDGHAYSIWSGESLTMKQVPKISPRLYDRIASDYREAARLINAPHHPSSHEHRPITPAQLQAITWTTHRRLKGIV